MVRNTKQSRSAIKRRRLLQGIGAAGAVSLAGCIGDESFDGEDFGRATDLLEEGFDELGMEPPFETDIITNENPERVNWTQIVQQRLEDTGYFDLSLEQYEWTTYQEVVLGEESADEDHLAALGWSAGYDPDAYVNFLLHSNFHTPACCNVNHFENDEVDQLISDGQSEMDPDARIEIYQDLQREIVKQSPLSYVRFGEELIAHREEALDDWTVSPFDSTMFSAVYHVPSESAISFDDPDDDGELKAAIGADIANFDPPQQNDTTSSQTTDLIFESLTTALYDGEPKPLLAEDWEQVDETTWRFFIREGVEFHNGEELTADHVRASFERYEGQPREADVFDWLGEEGEIEVEDDYTIVFHLEEAHAPLLFDLSAPLVVPMAGIEEEYGGDGDVDLQEEPIGTGSYQHVEYQPDELYRVGRFDDYWGHDHMNSEPAPETIQFRVIVESSVRQSAVQTGDVHVVSPPPASFDDLDDDDEIVALNETSGGFDFLIQPIHHEPFTNEKVRRAVSLLIPRDRINDNVYDGIGVNAYGPISPVAEQFALDEGELIDILEE